MDEVGGSRAELDREQKTIVYWRLMNEPLVLYLNLHPIGGWTHLGSPGQWRQPLPRWTR